MPFKIKMYFRSVFMLIFVLIQQNSSSLLVMDFVFLNAMYPAVLVLLLRTVKVHLTMRNANLYVKKNQFVLVFPSQVARIVIQINVSCMEIFHL